MNSVPRKLTLGLILAVGAAACGDDVTVQQTTPVTPTPVVRSVVVSPSSATIAPGGTFTFGAAVDADAPLARTVTWSSSNANVTVTAAGVASAPSTLTAGGVASICAASTANADVKGCAQLTVTPGTPPATVSINAITNGCTPFNIGPCGLLAPVNINNIQGQIDIQVNVRGQTGTSPAVVVEIETAPNVFTEFGRQTLLLNTASENEGLAAQTTNDQVVTFSVNTAAYKISAANIATVDIKNGQRRIRARLDLGNIATQQAVAEQQLTFNNINGFHIFVNAIPALNSNGVASRLTDALGYSWTGGVPMTINAIPVSYNLVTTVPAVVTLQFGGSVWSAALVQQDCDQNPIVPFVRGTNGTLTAGVWTATLAYTAPGGAAATSTSLNDYEHAWLNALCVANGEFASARGVNADGSDFFEGRALPVNTNFSNTLNAFGSQVSPITGTTAQVAAGKTFAELFRIDNGRPTAPTIVANPNNRENGWFNDAVLVSTLNSADVNGIVGASTDLGVSRAPALGGLNSITYQGFIGAACTSAASCLALGSQATPASPLVPETAVSVGPGSVGVMTRARDLFLNAANSGIGAVGIDRTNPGVQLSGAQNLAAAVGCSVGASCVLNPNDKFIFRDDVTGNFIGSNWTIFATDQAPALPAVASGVSTIFPNLVTITQRVAAGTLFWCPTTIVVFPALPPITPGAFQAPSQACSNWVGGSTPWSFRAAATTIIPLDPSGSYNVQGYYLADWKSRDQAGNTPALAAFRSAIYDEVVPVITSLSFNPNPLNGFSITMFAGATDNVDLGHGHHQLLYPKFPGFAFQYPRTTTGFGDQGAYASTSGATQRVLPLPVAPPVNYAGIGYTINQPTGSPLVSSTGLNQLFFNFQTPVNPFWRSLEIVTAGNTGQVASSTTYTTTVANQHGFTAIDVAGYPTLGTQPLLPGNTGVTGTTVAFWNDPAGAGAIGWAAPPVAGTAGNTFTVTGAAAACDFVVGGAVCTQTLTATIISNVVGWQAPFTGGLQFWVTVPNNAAVVRLACTAGTPLYIIGNNSWNYSCSYDLRGFVAQGYPSPGNGAINVFAVGIRNIGTSTGRDAIITNGSPFAFTTTSFPAP